MLLTWPEPLPAFETVKVKGPPPAVLKVAVAVLAAVMVTAQVPVPAQAPDQPAKVEPATGLAVRVTTVPLVYASVQSVPQLIPAGELVTVPEPVPVLLAVKVKGPPPPVLKVAVTVLAAFMVPAQVPVPVQAPDQPAKVEPAAGVAVRFTMVPLV